MGFWQIPVPRQVGLGSILSEKWGVGPSGGSAGRHDGGVWRHQTQTLFGHKVKSLPPKRMRSTQRINKSPHLKSISESPMRLAFYVFYVLLACFKRQSWRPIAPGREAIHKTIETQHQKIESGPIRWDPVIIFSILAKFQRYTFFSILVIELLVWKMSSLEILDSVDFSEIYRCLRFHDGNGSGRKCFVLPKSST